MRSDEWLRARFRVVWISGQAPNLHTAKPAWQRRTTRPMSSPKRTHAALPGIAIAESLVCQAGQPGKWRSLKCCRDSPGRSFPMAVPSAACSIPSAARILVPRMPAPSGASDKIFKGKETCREEHAPSHRPQMRPAISRSGCSPALPVSASPARAEYHALSERAGRWGHFYFAMIKFYSGLAQALGI